LLLREREVGPQDRRQRDHEIAEEREQISTAGEDHHHYQEESEHCIQEMRHQMDCLQALVGEHATATNPAQGSSIKLTRLGESDNIEAYLTMFKWMMEVNEISREHWPFQLAPQLTGRAQQAYAALTPEDAKDYDTVRTAILQSVQHKLRNLPAALPSSEAEGGGVPSGADDPTPRPGFPLDVRSLNPPGTTRPPSKRAVLICLPP
jgi:hypothetical protein